jgi:type III secretion system YscQ/HrcQ family protein
VALVMSARPPRVRPFPLAELPRLLRVQVELSRALLHHLAGLFDGVSPEALERLEEALSLGELALSIEEPYLFPESGTAARVQGGLPIALELFAAPPRPAVLVLDARLQQRLALSADQAVELLREVLAGTPSRALGPLSPAEVGPRLAQPGQLVLGLDLTLYTGSEPWRLRLLFPADLRLGVPPPLPGPALMRLWQRRGRLSAAPVTLTIEAGHGFLSGAQVAALEVGDVVILDHFGPRPILGGPVYVRVSPTGGAFGAHLDGEGLTVLRPFEPRGAIMVEESAKNSGAEDQATADRERLLSDLPILVVCEIGRVSLTGREVLELRPGAVLPVGRPLAGPVDLSCGGRVIARGELVDVEGEIGVRVTEVIDE